ncbi:nucleotidyltransferase family protein [Microbacterium resistens]|uniref:Nucleotidyltransferase family protein n=1 Tax=Microbacterium resistens TaxID=156977 RepID=A0ABY3RPE2_9MICO|nr:nucleotidyltransferase family protein [Microbacterium resistens]UGS25557.1 nucleotidyltransferase family protein [Microbacterium resistens]
MGNVVVEGLRRDAERADALQRESRDLLVGAVQRGMAAGLTQREIAQAVGRSQPEVSRLARQRRNRPLAHRLAAQRGEVLRLLTARGVAGVRVFGSVATGSETSASDIDLLIDVPRPLGLLTLARLERDLSRLLGAKVDLVPSSALSPHLRDRVLAEAVPL